MTRIAPIFTTRLAENPDDLRAAQRLRYRVFVEELGADGDGVDHENRLETDIFDPFFDHLLLLDEARPDGEKVVGVYRLLRDDQAKTMGRFYSEDEYDLSALLASGRKLLELGRSCLHPDYRGGMGMYHLWSALSRYVDSHGIEVLFGVASFHGTDPLALAQPLGMLHYNHLAPPELRVRARPDHRAQMDTLPDDQIDRRAAMLQVPSLIKAYLRSGGFVGDGAYIDHAFNTIDVCLILDVAKMSQRQRSIYSKDLSK